MLPLLLTLAALAAPADDVANLLDGFLSEDPVVWRDSVTEIDRLATSGSKEERAALGPAMLERFASESDPNSRAYYIRWLTIISSADPNALQGRGDELISLATDQNLRQVERIMMLLVLGNLGEGASEATPALRELLEETRTHDRQHNNVFTHAYAAYALYMAAPGDHEAIEAMVALTEAEDPPERWLGCVAMNLTKSNEQAFLEVLQDRLEDDNPSVRVCAAEALWQITRETEPSLTVLLSALDEPASPFYSVPPRDMISQYANHIIVALDSIESIGAPAESHAVELCELFREEDQWVSTALMEALLAIAPRSEEVLHALTNMNNIEHESTQACIQKVIDGIRENLEAPEEESEE